MAEKVSIDDYNEIVEEKNLLERELRAKDKAIIDLTESIGEKKDQSWFTREIDGEKKKTEKALAKVKTLEEKIAKDKRESAINEADALRIEEARIEEIRKNTTIQSEHSRFRVLPRVPSGERDLFGDPTTEVFDTGVYYSGFYGGIYLPVATVVEMGQSIGMLTAEDSNALKNHSIESTNRADRAPLLAKELQDGIDRLIGAFNDELDSATPDVSVGDENTGVGESESDSPTGQADSPAKDGIGGTIPGDSGDAKLDLGKDSEPSLPE